MNILFAMMLCSYSVLALASDEILLKDTQCKVIGSNRYEVKSTNGSLITYICTKNDTLINCSTASKTGTMYGNRPSTITNYSEIRVDKDVSVWVATSHEGIIILDINNERYSLSSTQFLEGWLFNKNCVGHIEKWSNH